MPDSFSKFLEQTGNESHLRVESDFGDGFVRLKTSEAERRQAIQDIRSSEDIVLELLRNSRDAGATEIYVATYKEENKRHFVIIDDGVGIPENLFETIFEPRVTSKLDTFHLDKWGAHGRGMALYSIKENADTARVVKSIRGKGTSIEVITSLKNISERSDQSSFPSFSLQNGVVIVTGPKNILRVICEFSLEHRNTLKVFLGSPSDIVSTLCFRYYDVLDEVDRIFYKKESDGFLSAFEDASSPSDLATVSNEYGLDISERTARRILDSEITPLTSLADIVKLKVMQLAPSKSSNQKSSKFGAKLKQKPKLSISASDLHQFAGKVTELYSDLAQSYYFEESVDPKVRIANDTLTISIPLVERKEDI